MAHEVFDTPIGPVTVWEKDGEIVRVKIGARVGGRTTPLLAAVGEQLYGFFYCGLEKFDLPIAEKGTPLRRKIYRAMRDIPRGRVAPYGDLAHLAGAPGAARAAGTACAQNDVPILVPCHRVVASTGLGGYSGGAGLDTKRALLELEGVDLAPVEKGLGSMFDGV